MTMCEVLAAVLMIQVFWDGVVSVGKNYRRFEGS
jgi:hypothetical protein